MIHRIYWISIMMLSTTIGAGCSSDSGDGDNDTDSTGEGDTSFQSDAGDDGPTGDLGEAFRYGINGGHRNASWGDDVQAELEARAGCNSQRISLPERHLDQWGYEIEVNDMEAYAALGMSAQVAFLTAPIRDHSTAPSDVEDWELAYYLPANIYEPVVLADGTINPDNYWAKYVYDTVSVYKKWIKVWEIWNEPDFVTDWNATLTWHESPPTAEQLIRFNGTIYEYVRLLRISRQAARLADPDALIATGGIGYASFLSALLRYTDNPEDGSVTTDYPKTGAAYFDVLSFHHYPIYTDGTADDGVAGYLAHFTDLKAELDAAGKTVVGFENTETGAPHIQVGDYPGGASYAREYLMKVMISAQREGIHGIDWFVLSDGALEGASDTPYDYMGLYEDVVALSTIDEAVHTDTGTAYRTLGTFLGGALIDQTGTAALPLDGTVDGAVFETAEGRAALALWTIDTGSGAPAEEVSWPSDVDYRAYAWNFAETDESTLIATDGATVLLPVSGDVTIFIAE